jgi:hypothetical protein
MAYVAMRGSAAVNAVSRPPWRREPDQRQGGVVIQMESAQEIGIAELTELALPLNQRRGARLRRLSQHLRRAGRS